MPTQDAPVGTVCASRVPLILLALLGCGQPERQSDPEPVWASEFRSPPVDEALVQASAAAETRGFRGEGEQWRGFLVENDSSASELTLEAESCYLFVASASVLVEELSLRVFGSAGGEVARDSGNGPNAALRYCPVHPGLHYLAVYSSGGSGLFAVSRFKGPSGLDVSTEDLFQPPIRLGTSPPPVAP